MELTMSGRKLLIALVGLMLCLSALPARAETFRILCGQSGTFTVDTTASTVSWIASGYNWSRPAKITSSSIDFQSSDTPLYKSFAHIDRVTGQMTDSWSNFQTGKSGTLQRQCQKAQGQAF
jgi:hypothetical protein